MLLNNLLGGYTKTALAKNQPKTMFQIRTDFDDVAIKRIATAAKSKQAYKDVGFAKRNSMTGKGNYHVEWIEGVSFCIANKNKEHVRLIGMATAEEYKHHGYAHFLLQRLICQAIKGGYARITTRTLTGAVFYARHGFKVVGTKGGDYLMELAL